MERRRQGWEERIWEVKGQDLGLGGEGKGRIEEDPGFLSEAHRPSPSVTQDLPASTRRVLSPQPAHPSLLGSFSANFFRPLASSTLRWSLTCPFTMPRRGFLGELASLLLLGMAQECNTSLEKKKSPRAPPLDFFQCHT